jgi:tetratricopeptide (TPR) repeat protein
MMLLGRCEAILGNYARALKSMREAYDLGAGAGSLVEAAQLAAKLGQLRFALNAWEKLCDEFPRGAGYCASRDEVLDRLNADAERNADR